MIQPNEWSCMLYAFAEVTGIRPERLIEAIGHDGSEIIDGERRGFNIQEIISAIWKYGCTCTEMAEIDPAGKIYCPHCEKIAVSGPMISEQPLSKEFQDRVTYLRGVLGLRQNCKYDHAVVKIGGRYYDPSSGQSSDDWPANAYIFWAVTSR